MKVLFQSDRLLFRTLSEERAAALIDQLNADHPQPYSNVPSPEEFYTTRQVEALQTPMQEYGYGRWSIYLKYSDELIGWCGLKYDEDSNAGELGYHLLQPYRGQGYASESVNTCIAFAFAHLPVNRIIARSDAANTAAINVLERCGMRHYATETNEDATLFFYEVSNQSGNFSS